MVAVTLQWRRPPARTGSADALGWLQARFAGLPAPSSCGSIAPGNSLKPVELAR